MQNVSLMDRMDAHVCSGQREKAAQDLAAMIEAPAMRASAILTVQLYEDRSKAGSDLNDLRYRLRALVASESVQAAIKLQARTLGLPFTFATAR
jgi:hypothetical protein